MANGDKKALTELFADAMVAGRKEVVLKYNGADIKFYAVQIGFLAFQDIAVKASSDGKNSLALMVSECIEDADGNKFTYDEACKLKREFAEPLFNAVVALNEVGEKEKN